MHLPEIHENDAPPRLEAIYADIRQTLAVPVVNLIYRHMAVYPNYLPAVWTQLRRNLRTRAVWEAADRIAAAVPESDIKVPREALSAVGVNSDELAKIRAILRFYNGANPKNLMGISALLMSWDGQAVGGADGADGADGSVESDGSGTGPDAQEHDAVSVPPPPVPLPMYQLNRIDANTLDLLSAMSKPITDDETAPTPDAGRVIPSLLRHFAQKPGFLAVVWTALKPYVESASFRQHVTDVVNAARQEAGRWPFPVEAGRQVLLQAGCSDSELETIYATLEHFLPTPAGMVVVGTMIYNALAPTST